MRTVEERLLALEDEREIRNLVERYGLYADFVRNDDFSDLYTEDAVIKITFGGYFDVPEEVVTFGVREILLVPKRQRQGRRCHHHAGAQMRINVTNDTAEARGYSFVIQREESGLVVDSAFFRHWRFRRTDAGWRIAHVDVRALASSSVDDDYMEALLSLDNGLAQ